MGWGVTDSLLLVGLLQGLVYNQFELPVRLERSPIYRCSMQVSFLHLHKLTGWGNFIAGYQRHVFCLDLG